MELTYVGWWTYTWHQPLVHIAWALSIWTVVLCLQTAANRMPQGLYPCPNSESTIDTSFLHFWFQIPVILSAQCLSKDLSSLRHTLDDPWTWGICNSQPGRKRSTSFHELCIAWGVPSLWLPWNYSLPKCCGLAPNLLPSSTQHPKRSPTQHAPSNLCRHTHSVYEVSILSSSKQPCRSCKGIPCALMRLVRSFHHNPYLIMYYY